jgi:NAD(P)-dependent dehydrogenase (short-subunit alcohol dehydrogenase family)
MTMSVSTARTSGDTMLLEARNAIVYGGGGAIGGAVARAFAREGAHVFLAGRTQATLDAVADDIRGAGCRSASRPSTRCSASSPPSSGRTASGW